jgi:uncharacterized DUF497 family protein/uncharacterized protein (DUF4415 family)
MAFEWDEDNRKDHLVKHGVDLRDVTPMFDGPTIETGDDRHDYGETRINALGEIKGGVYAVAYTWRHASRRIISARNANEREQTTYYTRVGDEARLLKGETDYARLDAMTDEDIARAVADDPDAPPLDIDWTKARLVIPPGKDIITLRLDRDVLDWLRAQGKGYQTLINQILRAWYDAQVGRAQREKVGVATQKTAKKPAAQKTLAKAAARKTAAKRA